MKDLSPRARALLDRARGADGAGPQARARIRSALAASIAAGSGTLATGTAAAVAHAVIAKGTGLAVAHQLVGPLLVGAALGIGVAVPAAYLTRPAAPPTPPSSAVSRPRPHAPESARQPESRSSAPAEGEPRAPAEGEPRAPAEGEPLAPAEGEPLAPAEPGQRSMDRASSRLDSSGTTKFAAETRLLEEAQMELRKGQPARALELIEAHEARFADGALREERVAAKVLALCMVGRSAEARDLGAYFERVFAGSPLLPRVRGSCVGKGSR